MPIFEYQAIDPNGRPIRGTVHGSTLDAASRDLADRGYTVSEVHIAGDDRAPRPQPPTATSEASLPDDYTQRNAVVTEVLAPIFGRVGLAPFSFFFRQLGTMLDAGVNPRQALETLGRQSASPKLKSISKEMANYVEAGHPMSAAMQKYAEVFNPLTMSIVRAGEEGGFLAQAFTQIADYADREIALRNLIRRVTIYPKLVIAAAIVIFLAANEIIKSVAPQSPIRLTSPLTNIGVWIVLLPVLIGLFLFLRVGLHNPRIKYNWDLFLAYLPGIGKTVRQFSMAKFGRALGALYRAGVPIHRAFQLSADATGNEYLRAKMYHGLAPLQEGGGIAQTLRATGAFDEIVLNMADTGEQTGNLDGMLQKVSEYYEQEAETRATQLGWIFGVLCLLAVAVYVGYVYITNLAGIGGHYQEMVDTAMIWGG